jgi:hypothetical protein
VDVATHSAGPHEGEVFRAIIRLFCYLQSARHWLFQPLAQVNHPLMFRFEPGETTRKTP